ncbi:MAG: hypothetical protein U9P10_01815 [Thermodesulfobacteriota bacterium]|nr:hypothetical protein [Thermodesulfobacteriota bacterium]
MKLATEFNPLILVGAWNKHIFNPDWIGKFLLPGEKLEVEIPINVDGSARISTDNFRIFVISNKLIFSLRKNDDNVLEEIEELSLKIADYLPHTPIVAFGINLLFECDNNSKKLQDLFSLSDSEQLIEAGCIIDSDQIKHSFVQDNRNINLTLIKQSVAFKFDFNFHFNISNLVEFKEKINNNRLLDMKQIATSILNDVYDVE